MMEDYRPGTSPHRPTGRPERCDDVMCVRNNGKGICLDCLVLAAVPTMYACGGGIRSDYLENY